MRTSIGAAVVALLAFGAGALATSYFSGSSSVNAAQPAAASVPAVANGAAAPMGATALAPTAIPAVPTVQYISEPAAASQPVLTRTAARPARTPTVYRSSSSATASAATPRAPRLVRHTRSTKDSAFIIGGSTVGGAGLGAIIGGKKGALIGGLIGGAAGTVYDRTTRHKEVYE
jgi:hypothetical protein